MPTRFILSRIRAQEMADDGSNLDCIFFGGRTQSCGTLELARQLIGFVVVGCQQDQHVMWIGARFAGVTFGVRRMIEIR
jgi:hypothetical protein